MEYDIPISKDLTSDNRTNQVRLNHRHLRE